MLPNKMIYVSKADLSIFERAQELSGDNLSSTIAQTLRKYVEVEEAKQDGFTEIAVKLGENGTYRSKRFMGKELARTQFVEGEEEEDNWVTVFIVYVTANNRFALYTKEVYNWAFSELKQKEMAKELKSKYQLDSDEDISFGTKPGKYRLDVFETKEELQDHVPEELYDAVHQSEEEQDEFLDI